MKTEHEKLQKKWTLTLYIIRPLLKRLYGYTHDVAPEIEGNYLVLANHCSNLDPWLCGLSFKRQMYFLAGENVFRLGFLSWIVKKLWNPISKVKGKSDVTAMMKLIRHLKEGHNCSLFPEGNRSFNGVTGYIAPAIGKLAKTSGASLVTFKFEGLYFATPRWGNYIRRGKSHGSIVNVYTQEQLANMSVDEVNKHILEDLYENAYITQEKNPIAFKNKKRAECIESALYMCPKCNAVGSLQSKKHSFWCTSCNAKAVFTKYGYIEGDFNFTTVLDWDTWQENAFYQYIDSCKNESVEKPLLQDKYVELTLVDIDHNETIIDKGQLSLFLNRIEIGKTVHYFENINDFAIMFRRTLFFTTKENKNYQIFSKLFPCARHYILAYRYIMAKKENI